jgi:hypothetical protein
MDSKDKLEAVLERVINPTSLNNITLEVLGVYGLPE